MDISTPRGMLPRGLGRVGSKYGEDDLVLGWGSSVSLVLGSLGGGRWTGDSSPHAGPTTCPASSSLHPRGGLYEHLQGMGGMGSQEG